MATFTRPTFSEILSRVQADLNSRLEGTDSRLRRSVLNTLSYMIAGVAHGLYGFIAFIALQLFVDTAEVEYLNRWGAIYGISRQSPTAASGNITITGTNGTIIPIGTELQRSDLVIFETTAQVTISGGTATANVEAQVAGEDGNTEAASTLTFISPPSGADSDATVAGGGLTGGADLETDDDYRDRILDRIQNPAQGGSESDYETWAQEVTGVTRVWVYPLEDGPGTVTVRFMMDDTYDDGIPEAADVTEVQTYIDSVKPVTADVSVEAPTAVPLNFTIELIQNDTSTIRDAVEASLIDMLRRDAEPAGTLNLSRIIEAINLTEDVYGCVLTAPAADVTVSTGQISTMGTITWV